VNKLNFNDIDKEKVISFLNQISKNARFDFNTQELIEYFGLLSHMQKVIIPKINSNIFEIKEIVTPKDQSHKEE